jgi:Isochorismatase family
MKILSVDFQKDFSDPSGRWYKPRPCHSFIKEVLVSTLREKKSQLAEIISDYRLPRPSETVEYCIPGTLGYESEIPVDVKHENIWIKAMNSPAWCRDNGGCTNLETASPYCKPEILTEWFLNVLGEPKKREVVLIGLTLDCCVLATAQELYYRGYKVRYLFEGTDTYLGDEQDKLNLFLTPLNMWGSPISWNDVKDNIVNPK